MQHIINSAQTCLDCKKPKCQTGCPVKTPIADMIRLFLEGNIKEYKKEEYQIRLFFLSLISSPYTYIEHKRRNTIMNQIGKEKIYKYASQNEILKKYLDIVENDHFSHVYKYSQVLILFNDFCLIYDERSCGVYGFSSLPLQCFL